jgi:superfamily I DNA/RNA helicase
MVLPKLIGRQKEVLTLPAQGHFAVLGTAGSGKTTLAIMRAAYLATPRTDHYGKTLLVTFNRALVTYLKHLQDRQLADVSVENYHTFARGYLNYRNKLSKNAICSSNLRETLIAKAIKQVSQGYEAHPIFERSVDLFSEEIRWMAQHGITSFKTYQDVERVGRAGARIERIERKPVFEIYEIYRSLREQSGKHYDWYDIATAVCAELSLDNSIRRYRHVVIDEGQDFSPEMIRSLAAVIPADGSLTFFGDVAQQIYGHRMSWRDAGLNITKVWEFKENYRNSKQIAQLALAISQMPYFKDVPDLVQPTSPPAAGPLPTLVSCSSVEQEIELAVEQARQSARTLSVVILLRDRQAEKLISKRLPKTSIRLDREMTTWQVGPNIWYGTYHSAKGLEFDVVILPFCSQGQIPDPDAVVAFGQEDARAQDGRLLYVGVTRAKTRLIMTYSGEVTCLLPTDTSLYQRMQY